MYKFVITYLPFGEILPTNGSTLMNDSEGLPLLFDDYTSASMYLNDNYEEKYLVDEEGDCFYKIDLERIYHGYVYDERPHGISEEEVICSDIDFAILEEKYSEDAKVASGKYISFSGETFIFAPRSMSEYLGVA